MKISLWILATLCAAVLCGCGGPQAAVVPPRAFIYTHFSAPLKTDYTGGDLGTKKGTTTCRYILVPWPVDTDVAWDEAAMRRAAREGNIAHVKAADYEYMSVLGIYQEFTVYAYGD